MKGHLPTMILPWVWNLFHLFKDVLPLSRVICSNFRLHAQPAKDPLPSPHCCYGCFCLLNTVMGCDASMTSPFKTKPALVVSAGNLIVWLSRLAPTSYFGVSQIKLYFGLVLLAVRKWWVWSLVQSLCLFKLWTPWDTRPFSIAEQKLPLPTHSQQLPKGNFGPLILWSDFPFKATGTIILLGHAKVNLNDAKL